MLESTKYYTHSPGLALCRVVLCLLLSFVFPKSYSQELEDIFPSWNYLGEQKSSMYTYLATKGIARLEQRKLLLSSYTSKTDWLQRQSQLKKIYRKVLGDFPQKTALNPVITGVVEQDGITVEKLYFQSLPGYYVTAAMYLPTRRKGKLPVILFCSGHSPSGFRSRGYQHSILNFVKKGFAVLAFDPIGQGERRQFLGVEGRKTFNTTQDHSYPGSQLFLTGRSPGYYFIWDGIRAIDYLCTRPEIDTTRIGITGRSGGGTQTAYIAAFDNRIKAAAPECYITSFEKLLMTRGPQDAEQNFAGSIAEGLDIGDLLISFAPKPMLMVTTTRDIFSIQGARDVFKEVKQAYAHLGKPGNANMVEDDAAHASTRRNREATYRFFQEYLANPGNSTDEETVLFKDGELNVVEGGDAYASLKGENLQTLAKNYSNEIIKKRPDITGKEDLKKRIAGVTGIKNEPLSTSAMFSGRYKRPGYSVETYLLKGVAGYIPVYWLKPDTINIKKLVLLLDDRGKKEAARGGGLADSLALAGYEVVIPDLSGFGELASGYIKGGDAWVDKVPMNLWYTGILINESLLAERIKQILVLTKWIKQTHADIEGVARAVLTIDLLHAAMINENDFKSLVCTDPLVSYQSVIDEPVYKTSYILSGVPGMIGQYDIYHLIQFLSIKTPLLLVQPRNGAGDIIGKTVLAKQYELTTGNRLQAEYQVESFRTINSWLHLKKQ